MHVRPTLDIPSYERVSINDVIVPLRVGLYDAERSKPQPVNIDVALMRRRRRALAPTTIEACLDYDQLFNYVMTVLPARPHAELLEEIAEEIVDFCLSDPRVDGCHIKLRKIEIYQRRAVPELEIWRRRDEPG